jgi:MFS family permease
MAPTPAGLLWSVILFQVAFNAMFAPLGAVLADKVPAYQRGLVSSLLGLGYPLGNLIGTQTIGGLIVNQNARFGVLAILVAICIIPFACVLRPSVPVGDKGLAWREALLMNPFRHRDFSYALASRVLIVTAFSLVQGYLLLYLQQLKTTGVIGATRPEAAFAELAAIATGANVVCALIGGAASDRAGRRGWFVLAAGSIMAIGIIILAGAESWRGLQAGSLVYGCGAGLFYAVDLALIVQVLPSLQNAGKDLGIVNLSNTLPQAMAPLIALALLGETGLSFRALFLCGASTALLGAVSILRVRNR